MYKLFNDLPDALENNMNFYGRTVYRAGHDVNFEPLRNADGTIDAIKQEKYNRAIDNILNNNMADSREAAQKVLAGIEKSVKSFSNANMKPKDMTSDEVLEGISTGILKGKKLDNLPAVRDYLGEYTGAKNIYGVIGRTKQADGTFKSEFGKIRQQTLEEQKLGLQYRVSETVSKMNNLIGQTKYYKGLRDYNDYLDPNKKFLFDELKKHLTNFSPEKMADICGIDAETLRTVARTYATAKSSIIFWGMGISQHIHVTDNARCLIDLSLMTGQIGRPGTGLHPLRGQNKVQGASDAGLVPMFFPDYQAVDKDIIRQNFERFWEADLDPQRGLTVVEIMQDIHAENIRGMYIMGENPAMSDPDAQHAREGLAKLETLVVQDIFLTETAFYADVVLPASAWPEKDGTVTNTNRQVQMGRWALPLQGNTKQDWWIIQEIAQRMGLNWKYEHPKDVFSEMTKVMPSLKNITWERVEKESAVIYPCDAPDQPGNEIVFSNGFPTISGLGKMVPAQIIAPDEVPDDEYPMVLTTGRQLEHWHTGAITRRAAVLDTIEPEAVACLNSFDVRKLGIQAGEMIKISTRRGAIEIKVRIDRAVPAGMVFIPFCYAEAPANFLTNPQLDPFGKIPEFKFCAARVDTVKLPLTAAE